MLGVVAMGDCFLVRCPWCGHVFALGRDVVSWGLHREEITEVMNGEEYVGSRWHKAVFVKCPRCGHVQTILLD